MRELVFTRFSSARNNRGLKQTKSWADWIQIFRDHKQLGSSEDSSDLARLNAAKDHECVVLGEILEGATRSKVNTVAAHAIGVDLDGIPTHIIADLLGGNLEPYEWVAYTTHKHGSIVSGDLARLRVILPFARPVQPDEYPHVWTAVQYLVRGLGDESTRDICRLHYLPSTFDLRCAWSTHHTGQWLDPSNLPDCRGYLSARQLLDGASGALRCGPLYEALARLRKGHALADRGERHNTILELAAWFGQKLPDLSRSDLDAIFFRSLIAMADPEHNTDEVWTAYQGWLTKTASNREYSAAMSAAAGASSATLVSRYSDAELETIATKQGCAPQDLKWLIQRGTALYILDQYGTYQGPFLREDQNAALMKLLERAPLDIWTRKGRLIPREQMLKRHGAIAKEIVADLRSSETKWDDRLSTLYEAVSPQQPITPQWDGAIDQWLTRLFGDQFELGSLWLRSMYRLDLQLPLLHLWGASGAGKSFLIQCLAWAWGGAPTPFRYVAGTFNESIARCPLISIEETLCRRIEGVEPVDLIRELTSMASFQLTRKYLPPAMLRGSVRLIAATNGPNLFARHDVNRDEHGVDALADRIRSVKVGATQSYLASLHRSIRQRWLSGAVVAHVLAMSERQPLSDAERDERFVLPPIDSETRKAQKALLLEASDEYNLCSDALAEALVDPKRLAHCDWRPRIAWIEGSLWLASTFFAPATTAFLPGRKPPTSAESKLYLRTVRKDYRQHKRIWMTAVDEDLFGAWLVTHGYDPEQIFQNAAKLGGES